LSDVAISGIPYAVCTPQETNTWGSVDDLAKIFHIFEWRKA